jgi:1-phosphofructokinase family hexose kinase
MARARETIVAAGGKGVNVARAAQRLGGKAVVMGFLGGYSGQLVAYLAQAEGLGTAWTWIEGETRTCIIVVPQGKDRASDEEKVTSINEPGPIISAADWTRLRVDVVNQVSQAKVVCLSGSLPLGCPAEAPADLIQAVLAVRRPVWLDSSGRSLKNSLAARPTGLKINRHEASEIWGTRISDVATAGQAGRYCQEMGIENVVLTMGSQGAIFVNEAGSWWAQPPAVSVVSTVGSGDAFLAALLIALLRGESPATALRQAVAAGAANALGPGGSRFELGDFYELLARTVVTEVS